MKKVLITGANSYIGTSFANWASKWPEKYQVDTVDMISEGWKTKCFAGYDAVFHVAGIVHQRETKKNTDLYYSVNRDLAAEAARKAKAEGVPLFIYMSSFSVYGFSQGVITRNTPAAPKSHYGKSKLQAEQALGALENDAFHIAIVRAPMIYGPGCRGNYQALARLARKLPFFPEVHNRRSMLYIDHLSALIAKLVDRAEGGLLFPQNEAYVCTSDMVRAIAEENGRKIRMVKGLQPVLRLAGGRLATKVFGDLIFDLGNGSGDSSDTCGFRESIRLTEGRGPEGSSK